MEAIAGAMNYLTQTVHPFILYLAAINILAFGVFAADCAVVKLSHNGNTGFFHGSVLTPIALFGGAAGMLTALTLFARHHINKRNVTWWISGMMFFIIWTVIVLIWSGAIVVDFSSLHIPNTNILFGLGIYLLIVNTLTFALFCFDKARACQHGFRLSEFTLLIFALLGGSLGGILSMKLLRHKTTKWYFKVGLPIFTVLQLGLLIIAYGANIL